MLEYEFDDRVYNYEPDEDEECDFVVDWIKNEFGICETKDGGILSLLFDCGAFDHYYSACEDDIYEAFRDRAYDEYVNSDDYVEEEEYD